MISYLKEHFIIQFIQRNAFRKEMVAVILLKLMGLFLLWFIVSHPAKQLVQKQGLVAHYLTDKQK